MIAQEEIAKGLLLYLSSEKIVPWNKLLFRATRDHTCKQLLASIIDYMNPDIDEFLRRLKEGVWKKVPKRVADSFRKSGRSCDTQ